MMNRTVQCLLVFFGCVLLAGTSAFASDMSLQWKQAIDFSRHEAIGDLATDAQGNSYVFGTSYDSKGYYPVLLKLDPGGTILWKRPIGKKSKGVPFHLNNLALDKDGNLLVVSCCWNGFLVHKVDPQGNILWKVRKNAGRYASAIAVDSDNFFYVAGRDRKLEQWVIVKFSPDGKTVWTACRPGFPAALATDSQGNLFVTGSANDNVVVAKYDPSGREIWVREQDFGGTDRGYGIATDADGSVAVAGAAGNFLGINGTWAVLKYDRDGNMLWTGPYPGDGRANDIQIAPDGSLFVIGAVAWNKEIQLHKYTAYGQLEWVQSFFLRRGGLGKISLVGQNDVFLAGSGNLDGFPSTDLLVFKYREETLGQ